MFFRDSLNSHSNIMDADQENFQFSVYSKIYILFCNREKVLNHKILFFLFHIIFLSVKDFEFLDLKVLKGFKFISIYKITFLFLKFVHFVMYLVNNYFRVNNEKFFFNKKDLVEFLIFYKFYLFIIFLRKKQINDLNKLIFDLYLNYIVYSIFYFLKVYLINLQNLELKKKIENQVVYRIPVFLDFKESNLFYKSNIYNLFNLDFNKIDVIKEDIPLYLFCSNRINYKTLEDSDFSIFLNNIRQLYRLVNKKINSSEVLNVIIKRAIPLYKIIYQRRGRNFIPLMTFIYNKNVRLSLGFKYILNLNKINGLVLRSYKNNLLINLLDIIVNYKDNDFIYQGDKDSKIRKEAYSKGYFLKTFKAKLKKK